MSSLTPDQIFSMQMEITELRNQVSNYKKLGDGGQMELMSILEEKEKENRILRRENDRFKNKFASVEGLLGQLEDERNKLKASNNSLNKKLDDNVRHLNIRETEVSTLQARVQDAEAKRNYEIRELKTDNAALKSENMRYIESISHFEAKQVQFEILKREKAESDLRARESQESLLDTKRNYQRSEESLNASISYLKRVIKEQEISEQESQKKIQKCEKFRIEQTKKQNAEIAKLRREQSEIKKSYEKLVKEKIAEADKLVEKIDAQENNFQLKQAEYESKLTALGENQEELEIRLKRCIRESEEKQASIETLRSEKEAFKKAIESHVNEYKETQQGVEIEKQQMQDIIGELEKEKSSLSEKVRELAKLQQRLNNSEEKQKNIELNSKKRIDLLEKEKVLLSKTVDSLTAEIEEMKLLLSDEKAKLKNMDATSTEEIQALSIDLKKAQISIHGLQHEKKHLKKNVEDLNDSLNVAEKVKTLADRKSEKLKAELELLINSQTIEKAEHRRCIAKVNAELSDLQKELSRKEEAIKELSNVKVALDERREILKNMVTQNRQLSDDYAEAKTLVSELQEEMDGYLREKENAVRKSFSLEKNILEIEKKFHVQLEQEKSKFIQMENNMQKMKKEVGLKHKLDKQYEELQKENCRLKDKIRRQEGFLKKKLNQDRAMRQNLIHTNSSRSSKGNRKTSSDSFSLVESSSGSYELDFDGRDESL